MKANLFIKQIIGTLLFYAAIFICAGYFLYLPGLVYAAIGVVMILLNYSVLKPDRALTEERSKPGDGAKRWDKAILGISFLASVSMFCVAGFDSGRFHWSPEFHWTLFASGIILTIAGQLLFLIAQKQNRFFQALRVYKPTAAIQFAIPACTALCAIRPTWDQPFRPSVFRFFSALYGVSFRLPALCCYR